MNKTLIKNEELKVSFIQDCDIKILKLNEENLLTLGWLDDKRYPSGEFVNVLDFLKIIVPTEYKDKVVIWDPIEKGFGLYNVFLENGNE